MISINIKRIYGIGDGTDNTSLYASGDDTADADAAKFNKFLEDLKHGGIENREAIDRWSESVRRIKRDGGGYLHDLAYGRADAGNVPVYGQHRDAPAEELLNAARQIAQM